MSNSKNERLFSILLILFGFILGSFGTYFLESREKKSQRNSIIKLIKVGVEREIFDSKGTKKLLLDSNSNVGTFIPAGFDSLHDYSLYYSAKDRFGLLGVKTLVELDAFHRTLNSCRNIRSIFQEGLEYCQKNRQNKLPKGYLEVYLASLDNIISRGEKVLNIINKEYPHLSKFNPKDYIDSKIYVSEIPGYIDKDWL